MLCTKFIFLLLRHYKGPRQTHKFDQIQYKQHTPAWFHKILGQIFALHKLSLFQCFLITQSELYTNKHFPQTLQMWFLPWLHNGFWWLSSVHRGTVETWSWTNQGSKLLMQVQIQRKLLFPTHCFASPLGHCFAVIQGTAFLYHCSNSGTTWKSQLCYSCAKVHTAFRSPLLVFYQFPKKRKLLIIELKSLMRFFVNALTGCHPGCLIEPWLPSSTNTLATSQLTQPYGPWQSRQHMHPCRNHAGSTNIPIRT